MIIDFHTHTFPDKIASPVINKLSRTSGTLPYYDGTENGLLASMDAANIQYSVTLPVATNPDKISKINRTWVLEREDSRLIRFGAMHPDAVNWKEELHVLSEHDCKGIKIHPVYQGVDLDDIRYLRILDEAASLGMIVVTHAGDDIGFPGVVHCSPAMALHVIRQIGPMKLVLAHMGGWQCWQQSKELLADTCVLFDTALCCGTVARRSDTTLNNEFNLLTPAELTDMIHTFGSNRILFGTDGPWYGQKQYIQEIAQLALSDDEKANIFWKNAATLLSI